MIVLGVLFGGVAVGGCSGNSLNPIKYIPSITETQSISIELPTATPYTEPTSTPTPQPSFTPTITPSPTVVFTPHLEDDLTKVDNYAQIALEDITSGRLIKYIRSQIPNNPFPNGYTNCYYEQNPRTYSNATNQIYCQPTKNFGEMGEKPELRPIRILYGFRLIQNNHLYLVFAQAYANKDGGYGIVFIVYPEDRQKDLHLKMLNFRGGYLVFLFDIDAQRMDKETKYNFLEQFVTDFDFDNIQTKNVLRPCKRYQSFSMSIGTFVFPGLKSEPWAGY